MLQVMFPRKKALRLNFLTESLLGGVLRTYEEMKKVGLGRRKSWDVI